MAGSCARKAGLYVVLFGALCLARTAAQTNSGSPDGSTTSPPVQAAAPSTGNQAAAAPITSTLPPDSPSPPPPVSSGQATPSVSSQQASPPPPLQTLPSPSVVQASPIPPAPIQGFSAPPPPVQGTPTGSSTATATASAITNSSQGPPSPGVSAAKSPPPSSAAVIPPPSTAAKSPPPSTAAKSPPASSAARSSTAAKSPPASTSATGSTAAKSPPAASSAATSAAAGTVKHPPPPVVVAAHPPPPVLATKQPPPSSAAKTTPQAALATAKGNSSTVALTDNDYLIYALQLECLLADFYSYASTGTVLNSTLSGGAPMPTLPQGVSRASLQGPPDLTDVVSELAQDEATHVSIIRKALGTAAIACPSINIGSAFSDAANSAAGQQLNPAFSPYANELYFLFGAFYLEDLIASAYSGILNLIQNAALRLAVAEGVNASVDMALTEAYHAGIVRTLVWYQRSTNTTYQVSPATFVGKLADLANNIVHSPGMSQGVLNAQGKADLTPTDSSALVYSRNTSQVIKISTLGGASNKGGFFPAGFLGKIQ